MLVHHLELDLDVFAGPFDLLLSLVLREELDLLEIELAEIVLAYIDHLESTGELDLDAATEFLVLIAALLELKSRLMLPGEETVEELDELAPAEAAEQLVERMLQYLRFRGAGAWMTGTHDAGLAFLSRTAPLPAALRRVSVDAASRAYDAEVLGRALGGLLRVPPPIDVRHMRAPRVTVGERLELLRGLLRRQAGAVSFDDAVEGADRVTVAVTVWALLELYKRGEAGWEQAEPFGPITMHSLAPEASAPAASATIAGGT
jgi:segregation and condensation protein A